MVSSDGGSKGKQYALSYFAGCYLFYTGAYRDRGDRLLSYLNNRVFLSKALSCDRLPEEIWCSQQILA